MDGCTAGMPSASRRSASRTASLLPPQASQRARQGFRSGAQLGATQASPRSQGSCCTQAAAAILLMPATRIHCEEPVPKLPEVTGIGARQHDVIRQQQPPASSSPRNPLQGCFKTGAANRKPRGTASTPTPSHLAARKGFFSSSGKRSAAPLPAAPTAGRRRSKEECHALIYGSDPLRGLYQSRGGHSSQIPLQSSVTRPAGSSRASVTRLVQRACNSDEKSKQRPEENNMFLLHTGPARRPHSLPPLGLR